MRLFALKDSGDPEGTTLAIVAFYTRTRECYIDMPDGADPWMVPLLLSSFAQRGEWEIGPEWALRWVRSRLVPPSRQNLGEVLRESGLSSYDELGLLQLTAGRNSQDDCFLEPIALQDAPDWFKARENGRIADAVALGGGRAFVMFRDDRAVLCPLGQLAEREGQLSLVLADSQRYYRMEVGAGGRCLKWGSHVRVSASELREAGEPLPFTGRDAVGLAAGLLVDAAEASEMLGCSRQNVNALVKRGALQPVKRGAKSTLFLRADILMRMD